jgi:predicted RND superfamily exporter protein
MAAQELLLFEDEQILRDIVSFDRSVAAVVTVVPDHGSHRATQVLRELREHFAREEAATPGFRITVTGIYGVADGIYQAVVGGLARSLATAVAFTFVLFCFVLRSWQLAIVALVPNLLPLPVLLGMMSLLGIDVKPTTVMVFSVTLVIADDDTIQYLARFRRRFDRDRRAGLGDRHAEAAVETLRETGLPMLVTTLAVSLGFLTLLLSRFLGLAYLGLLIGISLLAAVLADLFLSPLLIMVLRPRWKLR